MNAQVKERTNELVLEVEEDGTVPATIPTLPPNPSPVDVVANLIARGVTPEQLDKFLEVQQKYEAEQARRAFEAAMAAFKGEEIAKIIKKKRVHFPTKNDGQVDYKHETLDQVVDAVRVPMSKHGLSASWEPDQLSMKPLIKVTCVVTHALGHSKTVWLAGPPDESGRKNPLQQVRSAITFLQRATLLMATGLAATGEDNDGRGTLTPNQAPGDATADPPSPRSKGGDGKATKAQLKILNSKLGRSGIKESAVLEEFKIGALAELTFDQVNDALKFIEGRPSGG